MMPQSLHNLPSGLGWLAFDAPKVTEILAAREWLSAWVVPKVFDSVLRGVAQVVFVNNPISGLLILLGLFIADVNVGYATLYCSIVALSVCKAVLSLPDSQISAGLPLFSPVLVGSVTASLFTPFFNAPITPAVWGYMGLAAAFSAVVFAGLCHLLSAHNLPAYTLPFNIATSIMFLGMRGAGYAVDPTTDPTTDPATDPIGNMTLGGAPFEPAEVSWSKVWLGALLSAGQVWAVENVVCSVLVGVGMLLCSPLLTATCFIGGTIGTVTALVVSAAPYDLIYAGVWGYNGFLASGAIIFFLVPSARVVLLAILNALLATFTQAALLPVFGQNKLPVFTYPFCLASLLALAAATPPAYHRVAAPSFPECHLLQHRAQSSNAPRREGKDERSTQHIA